MNKVQIPIKKNSNSNTTILEWALPYEIRQLFNEPK